MEGRDIDLERAVVTSALNSGQIAVLPSKKISGELIFQDDVKEVYEWALMYARQFGQSPSGPLLRERFPNWRPETVTDPLDALVVEFLDAVKRRYFESFVLELSEMPRQPNYRESWGRLDEIFLDKAREFAATIPSGAVEMFSADLESRIEQYEVEKGRYRPGIPMGIPVIDQTMQGIKRGWLVTTAGFSGMGKSFLSAHSSLNAFEDDNVVLFMSLEMSAKEVLERLDTMVMQWRHTDLARRQLSDAQVQKWRDVARVYSKARGEIVVLDKLGGCSLDRVHAEIERYKPDVAVIDYVQRMRTMYSSKRPKHEQLEEIVNDLKTVAMDTDTAVIMVSQDNRSAAETGSTSTSASQSISVFQAADAYLGLHQDAAMYAMNKMRIRLLKFRHGQQRVEVDVKWSPATGQFCELWNPADEFQKPTVPV